jgi:inositol-pentakisphosphate 2-kinase
MPDNPNYGGDKSRGSASNCGYSLGLECVNKPQAYTQITTPAEPMDTCPSLRPHPTSAPMLPSGVTLIYLAEGAANIIYRFTFPPLLPPSTLSLAELIKGQEYPSKEVPLHRDLIFERRLLRLRKALPSSRSNEQICTALQKAFLPFFPECIVAHDLVRLPPSLLRDTNTALRELEKAGGRLQKRYGLYLAEDEPHGILVTDMSPATTEGEVLVEFKPKWLVQSRSAPRGWKRCRTCALRAQKNAIRREKGQREEAGPCPLDLASLDQARVERAVSLIATAKHVDDGQNLDRLRKRLTSFLLSSTIIPKLKELQGSLDTEGVLAADVTSWDFLIATTIRDCSIYVKVSHLPTLYI